MLAQQLHVVSARAPGLTLLPQHLVLGRRGRIGEVGHGCERTGAALLDHAELVGKLLLAGRCALDLADRGRGVLTRALELADALGGLVLGTPQLLELGEERAAALVELERLVEHRDVEAAPA